MACHFNQWYIKQAQFAIYGVTTRHHEAPRISMTCKLFPILRGMYQSIKHSRIECFMVLFLRSSYYQNIKYTRIECFVVPCLCSKYQSTQNMSNECFMVPCYNIKSARI